MDLTLEEGVGGTRNGFNPYLANIFFLRKCLLITLANLQSNIIMEANTMNPGQNDPKGVHIWVHIL